MEDYLYRYDIIVSSICVLRVLKDTLESAREKHNSSKTAVSALLIINFTQTSSPTFPYKIIFVFSVQTLSLILITQPQGVWLFRNNHTPWRIRGIWLLPCLVTPQGHYLMIITSPGVALLLKCNTKF